MANNGSNEIGRAAAEGIVALRERWHTKNHPFYTDFHHGKFGLEPLGRQKVLPASGWRTFPRPAPARFTWRDSFWWRRRN